MRVTFTPNWTVEMTTDELYTLRRACDYMMNIYSYEAEDGKGLFEKGKEYEKLYNDLTKIIEHIPF